MAGYRAAGVEDVKAGDLRAGDRIAIRVDQVLGVEGGHVTLVGVEASTSLLWDQMVTRVRDRPTSFAASTRVPDEAAQKCPSCGTPMYVETTDEPSFDRSEPPQRYLLCPHCGDAIGDFPGAASRVPSAPGDIPAIGGARAERISHGRHCICSACAAQDWAEPGLAHCGMHGESCPPVYAPLGAAGDRLAPSSSAPEQVAWDPTRIIQAIEDFRMFGLPCAELGPGKHDFVAVRDLPEVLAVLDAVPGPPESDERARGNERLIGIAKLAREAARNPNSSEHESALWEIIDLASGPTKSDERAPPHSCAERWRGETFTIACCPTHGLHGGRETCFECGVRCEQVPVRVVERGES